MAQEKNYERSDVEQALQDELKNIQSAVIESYTDLVKNAVEEALNSRGIDEAWVSEVSVEPPDNIIPSQNSTCFNVYVPKVAHVKLCLPI